jgi:hypothetical protein
VVEARKNSRLAQELLAGFAQDFFGQAAVMLDFLKSTTPSSKHTIISEVNVAHTSLANALADGVTFTQHLTRFERERHLCSSPFAGRARDFGVFARGHPYYNLLPAITAYRLINRKRGSIILPMRWVEKLLNWLFATILILLIAGSSPLPPAASQRVHMLAWQHAFDYTSWTVNAAWVKLGQSALGSPRYFDPASQVDTVREYLRLVEEIQNVENEIRRIYANPNIPDASAASTAERALLDELKQRYQAVAPLAEATLEAQITEILHELGLTAGGQPIPWVLYHITPLPQNLVISERGKIQQVTSYLLHPDLTTQQAERIEGIVDADMDVSSLVVPVGGIALYPTMVMRTTALGWLSDTIAHEWIHVYLAYQPLGWNYDTSQVLRTMNETTASIAGNEIGRMLMERYYPEFLRRYDPTRQLAAVDSELIGPDTFPPPFDFRKEMYITRSHADELLAEGKIEEAESYLEERRQIFWARGYPIRKLNQAYFAFYGSYADVPGGPAGEDPVGPAVRELRARSASLKDFLDQIGRMSSFDELLAALEETE